MKAVILDRDSLDRGDLDMADLEARLPRLECYGNSRPAEVAARIREAGIVITNKVTVDRNAIRNADRLELILVTATGTNNVDLEAAREFAVTVCNARGYGTAAVVQHTLSLMLALSVRLPQYSSAVGAGMWQRSPVFCLLDYPIRELAGKNLGIVGYGILGSAVAKVAEAMGMRVLVAARPGAPTPPERVPLADLIREVDVLSLHCPLTDENREFVNAGVFQAMKRDAIFINTARGALVDERALADALRNGDIGGAGVDVLSEEPPPADHPLLAQDIPNLIVTPHCAWASREARQRLVDELVANIDAFRAGSPRNAVT